MKTIKASALLGIVVTLTVLALAACGSSGGSGVSVGGLKQTGPGLTEPTNPGGAKQTGGTVTWSEGPSAAPNYIFPMTAFADCSTANAEQFAAMMYRPLYWYGSNYKPTVDYNKSLAQKPVFSDGDKTVSITLNKWKWSNGEPVTARDAEFYINVYKGDPAKNYCGYAPGLFPDNVKSMSTPNPQTLVLHLDRAYNPEWFTYNELSQVTPMPLEWDRTSLSQPAQKTDNGHLPD
ncbi:MAG: hypothetical protein J2O48_11405, partial [Solirubrobacterales bacterium]|nr:hypothetical protein [Solirubrobacterales bacterium]